MSEFYRVDLYSWTASFRYPNMTSGIQHTLEVPPLSTVLGIFNAAAGKYLQHKKLKIGYYFEYQAMGFDLETIYQVQASSKGAPSNTAKSNIMKREFLLDAHLCIYLQSEEILSYLLKPVYDLLIGRSGDLAKITRPRKVTMEKTESSNKVKGQIIPFEGHMLPGQIQALPKYFTNEFPRKSLGTEAYSVIKFDVNDFPTNLTTYRDSSLGKDGIDIYFHELEFNLE